MSKVFVPAFLAAMAAAVGVTLAHAQPPQPSSQPPQPSSQPPSPPAPDAAAPAPPDAAAPADPALTLIQDRCSMCHDASLATTSHRSPDAWRDLVHEMVGKGANLSDDEAAQVVAYLSKNNADTPPPQS